MRFLLATGNPHKKKEVSDILSPLGYEIVIPRDLGLAFDPEETGATFEENALLKAREGLRLTGLGAIADDSGLCVEALQGRPGIYSARYGGEDLPFEQKIQLLLRELDGKTDRRAYFICAIAEPLVRCASGAARYQHRHSRKKHHRAHRSVGLRQIHFFENAQPDERSD